MGKEFWERRASGPTNGTQELDSPLPIMYHLPVHPFNDERLVWVSWDSSPLCIERNIAWYLYRPGFADWHSFEQWSSARQEVCLFVRSFLLDTTTAYPSHFQIQFSFKDIHRKWIEPVKQNKKNTSNQVCFCSIVNNWVSVENNSICAYRVSAEDLIN